jgi:hypothetical protein
MAITLDGLVRSAEAGQKAGVSASTQANLDTGSLDFEGQSTGLQAGATHVQLSVFGQVKSSFVDVQAAGKTLTTPAKISTVEDATKAIQSFADAYNNAVKIASSATHSPSAASGSEHANLANLELQKIVKNNNNVPELNKLGITINQDGTLVVDKKMLQSAVQENPGSAQESLIKIGTQALLVSQKALISSGNTGSFAGTSSVREKGLGGKSTGQEYEATDAPHTSRQPASGTGNSTMDGISAYRQMLSS